MEHIIIAKIAFSKDDSLYVIKKIAIGANSEIAFIMLCISNKISYKN